MSADLLAIQRAALQRATLVARFSQDHGPRHWRDVARIARLIGEQLLLSYPDLERAFIFAAVHDSQRESEHYDPEHGWRAAHILSEIGVEEDHGLAYALTHHAIGGTTGDGLAAVCWDADRLTIGRVGITPEARFMSSTPVRENFEGWCKAADYIRCGADQSWEEIVIAYVKML